MIEIKFILQFRRCMLSTIGFNDSFLSIGNILRRASLFLLCVGIYLLQGIKFVRISLHKKCRREEDRVEEVLRAQLFVVSKSITPSQAPVQQFTPTLTVLRKRMRERERERERKSKNCILYEYFICYMYFSSLFSGCRQCF